MKKLVGVSLFIFWTITVAIVTAGLVFYQNNKTSNCPTVSGPQLTGTASTTASQITLNAAEIAKHNSTGDCWLIISNKVYNVSSYLSAHPGGVATIAPTCGKDATVDYATKDIGRPHSSYAQQLLTDYYIGNLNQTIGQPQLRSNVNKTNTVTPPAGGRGEYEDD